MLRFTLPVVAAGRAATSLSLPRSSSSSSAAVHSAFHSSSAPRCGLLSVLQQSGPFSPVSTPLLTRWHEERDAVRQGVQRGLEAIRHRGPDGTAIWMSEDSGVALGHNRLAIIDLTPTGTQPLHHWRTNTHIAVNGEIYSWRDIRKEAEAAGFELTSSCDSEVALYLYQKHGISFPQYMRGEFAFTLWDEERKLLVAGRDRYGIKPLFYTKWQNQLLLASEMKALFAYGVPAIWDHETLATGGHLYSNRTIFKGVKQVPPGHWMVATPAGSVTCQKYYEFEYSSHEEEMRQIKAEVKEAETDRVIAEIRERLVDAVQQRMIADVPVAVYLSGGLDSCSILGVAAAHSPTPIEAFTISFGEVRFDEAKAAGQMAKHAKGNLHIVEATPAALADHFDASVRHYEYPAFNLNGTAKYMLSRAVRDAGLKVVMTGEGSDEIFDSFFREDYVRYHMDEVARAKGLRITQADKDRYLQQLRESNLLTGEEDTKWMKEERDVMRQETLRQLGYTPSMLTSIPFIHSASFFSPALRERFKHLHPLFFHLNTSASYDSRLIRQSVLGQLSRLNASMYLESKSMLPNILLRWLGDAEEMAHSVEGRVPFLDHRLVDYVNRLHLDYKLHLTSSPDHPVQLTEKWALKRAAEPFLPASILQREKHPFLAPPTLLNAHSAMYHKIRDTVMGRDMDDLRGVVDVDRVRHVLAAVEREVAEGRQATLQVRELLRLEQWLLMICSLNVLRKTFNVQHA